MDWLASRASFRASSLRWFAREMLYPSKPSPVVAIAQNASAEQRAKEVRRADSKRAEEEKEALVQRHGAQLKSLLALALADADMHLVATDDTRVRAQKSVLVKAIPYIARQDEFQVGGSAGAVRLLVALLYCGTDFPLDGVAADVLIETCELVTEWFDPLEARAVLGKLSEPLVATAKESVAGAIAVLACITGGLVRRRDRRDGNGCCCCSEYASSVQASQARSTALSSCTIIGGHAQRAPTATRCRSIASGAVDMQ